MSETGQVDNGGSAEDVARRFGGELARLRELHGSPSFERMHAAIRHVAHAAGSKNTFHRMVSRPDRIYESDFVRGFVLALGLTDAEADLWEERRVRALQEYQQRRDSPDEPEVGAGSRGTGRRKARIIVALAAGLTAVLLVATVIVETESPAPRPAIAARNLSGHPRESVPAVPRDGADPADSGCSIDPSVALLDSAEVDYLGSPAGSAQLIYSPHCGVAWARFQPFPDASIPQGAIVHVDIVRPGSLQVGMRYQASYVGAPIYGNVLHSTVSCVYAAVAIEVLGKALPESHTHCFRGETPVEP
jgi:hypothetical protein